MEHSPRGCGTLLEVMAGLVQEALLASAANAAIAEMVPLGPRAARHRMIVWLAQELEESIGLRFDPMDVPFATMLASSDQPDRPLSGYLREQSGYRPSDWLIDVFARWDVHSGLRGSWRESGRHVAANSRDLESARLQRVALHHCLHARETSAAVAYVLDIVETGLCRDVAGAGRAITMLLWAGAQAGTPEAMVGSYYGGRIPDDLHGWTRTPLREPDPAPMTAEISVALRGLIERAYARIAEVRATTGFDSWFTALTRAEGVIACVFYSLSRITQRPPLGIRTVRSQLSELDADYSSIVAQLRVARPPRMASVVSGARAMAATFRGLGDATGERYARERMLVPRRLLDHQGPLPQDWTDPGPLTAPILARANRLPGMTPEQALILDPGEPARWHALADLLSGRNAGEAADIAERMAGLFGSP